MNFETATAEILEVLDLALLGLCGTTLAIWPNVMLIVDFCPSLPMFSANALNMLWVFTGGFGLAMARDEICQGLGVRLLTLGDQDPFDDQDAHGSCGLALACAASIQGMGGGAAKAAALGGHSGCWAQACC